MASILQDAKNFIRELSDLFALFHEHNKKLTNLIFYSEKDIYYQYFQGLLEALSMQSGLSVCYITSDPHDRIFSQQIPYIKSFYINHSLTYAFRKFHSGVLVMTMTDLGAIHIPRASGTVEHVYVFHAIVSTHLQYRLGAFDHYDTIFCVGPHHVKEIQKTEAIYGLKAKKLIEYGYPRVEKIFRDHQVFKSASINGNQNRRRALIAPSWGDDNILTSCLSSLIESLVKADYEVVIRPHPESIKRKKKLLNTIAQMIRKIPQVSLELDMLRDASLHKADVLITDRSGIAFEYAFGTERPVLFIDTPLKIHNPDYQKAGIVPIEISTRADMGVSLRPDEMHKVPEAINFLLRDEDAFIQQIKNLRSAYVFNWLKASDVGAEYIIKAYPKDL